MLLQKCIVYHNIEITINEYYVDITYIMYVLQMWPARCSSTPVTCFYQLILTLFIYWKNRNIQSYTKIRIYKAAVLTILLYGSEVWNTTKKQLHRFEVFHQRCLRRILRIRWLDRVRNTEVLERAKINPVETYIGANRLRWFGHVTRMPDTRLPKYLLNWTPAHGRRSRGRPRKNWMKCLLEDAAAFTGNTDINLDGASEMASDRKLWREMIRHKREFIGAGHSND